MAIEVREGHDIDPVMIRELYELAPWARGRSIEGIKQMLENTDYVFTVWDHGQLAGFARVLTDKIYRATLWDIIVHPDFQGTGVGEALMNQILSHPVLSRVQKFWLNTRDKQSFYKRFGFVQSDQGMVREGGKEEKDD